MSTPQVCSWNWRKLLKIRDHIRPLIKHNIGDGKSTYIWHDHWHSLGPLLHRLGPDAIINSGIPSNALVSSFVMGVSWCWPLRNSSVILEVVNNLEDLYPNSSYKDSIMWLPSTTGKFSTASALEQFRYHYPSIDWAKLIWFNNNIPRASFILWLAVHGNS
ncbi:uncharacterized protein LOC112177615 [Rosa chinensis]|uniref:uncharacterized protein LOC112177615 n=1 Tax=Rosa chinensis TaxID=74649 RepID=UPI000D089C49|nr:uncharacterized protein LOC112177615 [Rosa chinensis]